ncbi:MAG TPA: glycoside hydrolase family 38 C-terminal domain-containing protein, partial [Coleofasciculaceae cyanobacterium]
ATLTTGSRYPRIQLEDAWKKVLFNQFHDILPGTSIPEVFVEANEAWQQVEQVGLEILEASLKAIASHIALPPPPQPDAQPLIIFNPLNWQRSELVAVSLPDSTEAAWEIYDLSGQKILSQLSNQQGAKDWGLGTREEFSTSVVIGSAQDSSPNPQPLVSRPSETSTLLFLAKDVPGVGYRVFWLCRCDRQVYPTDSCEPSDPKSVSITPLFPLIGERGREGEGERLSTEAENEYTRRIWYEGDSSCPSNGKENWVLENELLRVVVDPDTGDLSSVFDKIHQREVLSGPGNQLQAFEDSGQYWDAWNIDPNYAQHPLPPTQLKSIQWLELGPMRTGTPEENLQSSVSTGQSRLRVVRQLGQSQFCQDYVLSADSPILKIVTTVDWQERHVLVKAAFPLNLEANYATYEIPCGAIQRPTRPQTSAEQAKWEVSALRWADLGDETYGVSLLNDCKYGYDAQSSQLRLTLLRSPCWPDPEADRGIHQFTYALYPHSGSWQSASTVRRGYELNLPLIVLNSSSVEAYAHTPLQSIGRLLDFQAENLILTALKQSEDAPNQWIVRCYECHGESAELSLMSDLDLAIAHPVDVLERPIQTSEQLSYGQLFSVSPWKIASFLAMPGTE